MLCATNWRRLNVEALLFEYSSACRHIHTFVLAPGCNTHFVPYIIIACRLKCSSGGWRKQPVFKVRVCPDMCGHPKCIVSNLQTAKATSIVTLCHSALSDSRCFRRTLLAVSSKFRSIVTNFKLIHYTRFLARQYTVISQSSHELRKPPPPTFFGNF